MAIPFAQDRAIDAARGLYQLYLQHREKPVIVSTDRGTHFTGEVFSQYCKLMDIQPELHCAWRPQSTGNLERQHRTLKNSLFILCEERKIQWLDILQEVVSNMNAMANMSTGVSPHYIITGRHPSLNLPKTDNDQIRHPDPASYGMKVNDQMNKVFKAVAIAAKETDSKMESRLNSSPSKPLHPGDKVLLFRPESAEAKRNKLPWLEGYTVVSSNNMVVKIRNDENVTCWVHRTQLRYVPDRPEHLQKSSPLMIPVPVITQISSKNPQPPIGGHRQQTQIGSSEKRRSKIPILTETGKNRKNSTMTISNTMVNKMTDVSKTIQNPIKSSSRSLRRVTKSSAHTPQNRVNRVQPEQTTTTAKRYPERIRRPPSKFKDYVKH